MIQQSAPVSVPVKKVPIITFNGKSTHDFGTLKQGDKRHHFFEFTNTGNTDLVIEFVSGSCGCTVPDSWPTEPIPPGGIGRIEFDYDSTDKDGLEENSVDIISNTDPIVVEYKFKAFVEVK